MTYCNGVCVIFCIPDPVTGDCVEHNIDQQEKGCMASIAKESCDFKGTISYRQFQTSLFSKPPDFFFFFFFFFLHIQRELHCNKLPIQ